MTSPSGTDFRLHSEAIARSFLQTIVVVDDRAYFEWSETSSTPTGSVKSPARPRFVGAQAENSEDEEVAVTNEVADDSSNKIAEPVIEQARTKEETSKDRAHELDAKYLIESFAERGMNCAVLRPKDFEVEQLGKKLYPVAERSDIVMLDWVLHKDTEGNKVTELIAEMTKKSSQQHRLRLIVVYTGELEIVGIVDRIERAINDIGVRNISRKDDFTLVSGPVRIVVYAKNNVGGRGLSDELRGRLVPADQLPDKLISEFTEITAGLVSNVALNSLAAVRSNTHRLLSKFNSDIDAPFLAHRAMLPQPDDASAQLIHLIGSELTAVLEGNEVGKVADESEGIDVIKAWIDMNEASGYEFAKRFKIKDATDVLIQLNTLLRKGVADNTLQGVFKTFKNNPHKRELTAQLCSSSKTASDLDHEFASLTILKSDYRTESNPPALFPGTLLKEILPVAEAEPSFRYWICIQPVCDCVRITVTRSFPFLELELVDDKSKFELVLPDKSKSYVRAHVIYRPYKSRLEAFDPSNDGSRMVRAEWQSDGNYFMANNGNRYQWLAELKFEPMQRIVNKYAAELSRVGLDESEWLRRSARGKGEEE
jgi:hypothetical protein